MTGSSATLLYRSEAIIQSHLTFQTDRPSGPRQGLPSQIEIGQGKQGKHLCRILLQPPITHLPIPHRCLTTPKTCSTRDRVRLLFRLNDLSAQLSRLPRLALRLTRQSTPRQRRLPARLVGIRLVPVDDGLLTMQTVRHHSGIMHRGMRHRHTTLGCRNVLRLPCLTTLHIYLLLFPGNARSRHACFSRE